MQVPPANDNSQIIYRQNSGGRSGHQLKDLFTSVILGELLNLKTVYGNSWQEQSLLPHISLDPVIASHLVEIQNHEKSWDGISFVRLQEIALMVREKRKADTLFVLSGVCRIHLHQLHSWELAKQIPAGSLERCLQVLRKLFWNEETLPPFQEGLVAIHARRGDVADPNHHEYERMGPGTWDAAFYQEQIDDIHTRFNPTRITLYSEREHSEDLAALSGVTLELGGTEELQRHFQEMVSAEYFMPSCSSLSTWAAYLSSGTVLIPPKPIKHFEHPQPLPNWLALP